jgi:hypothetical protein
MDAARSSGRDAHEMLSARPVVAIFNMTIYEEAHKPIMLSRHVVISILKWDLLRGGHPGSFVA